MDTQYLKKVWQNSIQLTILSIYYVESRREGGWLPIFLLCLTRGRGMSVRDQIGLT